MLMGGVNASVVVSDVSLNFGTVEVLKSLDLEVQKGEFIVLLGPSGCGKSTLLNCIAGLLDVTTGQIFIEGKNVTWEQPKDRGIGMVFQSYALYPQMTVEGNLSFGLKNQRLPKDEIERRVRRASEILPRSPAASVSVLRSGALWCATSTSFSSTSRCPISTPSCATNSESRSSAFIRSSKTR
jgi:ABC-type Fe3+/spermidine/putrescine transport system ATPase subunit